jgi:hypothetical protein
LDQFLVKHAYWRDGDSDRNSDSQKTEIATETAPEAVTVSEKCIQACTWVNGLRVMSGACDYGARMIYC